MPESTETIKFKVYKVDPDDKQTLEFQLEVSDIRPGTTHADTAADYVLKNVSHETADRGTAPLWRATGVYVVLWLILDDTDRYWFIPGGRFKKRPEPIQVKGASESQPASRGNTSFIIQHLHEVEG